MAAIACRRDFRFEDQVFRIGPTLERKAARGGLAGSQSLRIGKVANDNRASVIVDGETMDLTHAKQRHLPTFLSFEYS